MSCIVSRRAFVGQYLVCWFSILLCFSNLNEVYFRPLLVHTVPKQTVELPLLLYSPVDGDFSVLGINSYAFSVEWDLRGVLAILPSLTSNAIENRLVLSHTHTEAFALLECQAALIGNYRRFETIYLSHLRGSSNPWRLDCLAIENVTDSLPGNLGK
jgi:hypothetical protein